MKNYFLTTKQGLFFYALYENSNFLGNNPKQWYKFERDCAAVFSTFEEAEEHKQVLIERIIKQGNDYLNNHLKRHPTLFNSIPEHEKKIKRVLRYFNSLLVTEKITHLNQTI